MSMNIQVIVSNPAAIVALEALRHEYNERIAHGTTCHGTDVDDAELAALSEFIDALNEADRIVICKPGQSPEEVE